MDEVMEIVQKYEVPKEYFDAVWAAYEAGTKRGFIKGGISVLAPTKPEEGASK